MRLRANMLRQHSSWLFPVLLALLLTGVPALAAKSSTPPPPPTKWAIVPLVVVGGEGKEAKQFQSAFEAEVGKSGIDRANPKLVSSFLSQESGCIRKDDCLGKLAKTVNSERTLLVTISPFAKEVVLTMKVVGTNGAVANESASTVNHGPNETVLAASRDSFQVMLGDLQTEPTPLSTPPEQVKPSVTQTEPKPTTSNPAIKPPSSSTPTPPVASEPKLSAVPPAALPSAPPKEGPMGTGRRRWGSASVRWVWSGSAWEPSFSSRATARGVKKKPSMTTTVSPFPGPRISQRSKTSRGARGRIRLSPWCVTRPVSPRSPAVATCSSPMIGSLRAPASRLGSPPLPTPECWSSSSPDVSPLPAPGEASTEAACFPSTGTRREAPDSRPCPPDWPATFRPT